MECVVGESSCWMLLPPSSQIISRFDISRYIDFVMHLETIYIYMYSKIYASKKAKMTNNNLERRE